MVRKSDGLRWIQYSVCSRPRDATAGQWCPFMVQDARNADERHIMTGISTSHDQDEWHGFSQRDAFCALLEMECIVVVRLSAVSSPSDPSQ